MGQPGSVLPANIQESSSTQSMLANPPPNNGSLRSHLSSAVILEQMPSIHACSYCLVVFENLTSDTVAPDFRVYRTCTDRSYSELVSHSYPYKCPKELLYSGVHAGLKPNLLGLPK